MNNAERGRIWDYTVPVKSAETLVNTSCVWRMLKEAESEITPCLWRVLKHLWTHLACEGCWNRQNLRLHLACEECWNTCEHILHVKNAKTGRIWGYRTMCVKNDETGRIGGYHTLLKQAKSEITTPCWNRQNLRLPHHLCEKCWSRQNLRLPHGTPSMWRIQRQNLKITTPCVWRMLENPGQQTNAACEECLKLNRLNLRSPCLFFALARERTFTKMYTLNVDVLRDQKIYCLQARPCIFQPGDVTDWRQKGEGGGLLPIKYKPSQLSPPPPPPTSPRQHPPPPNDSKQENIQTEL